MTPDNPEGPHALPEGHELFARKGRATARGFGSASTLDTAAAEVARSTRPRIVIELGRSSPDAPRDVPQAIPVLVADGDALSRKLYRDLLEVEGHEVVMAADGAEALEAARRLRPGIAIVNLGLADPAGIEVARRIAGEGADFVVVIAVTERWHAGDEAAARAAGCAVCLAKPIAVRTFLDTVDRLAPRAPPEGPRAASVRPG